MFTGIIEELGKVKFLNRAGPISTLKVQAPKISLDAQVGQSICVNGSCLTVVRSERGCLYFEIMSETIGRSNLGRLKSADKVNLERALPANGRIDGHFLTGHIDGTGRISNIFNRNSDLVIEVTAPEQILRYLVLKGSVALDGVSLTVSELKPGSFCVNLIPYTWNNSTLGFKKKHDSVNIECDILAKYIDKSLSFNGHPLASRISCSFLQEHGFI